MVKNNKPSKSTTMSLDTTSSRKSAQPSTPRSIDSTSAPTHPLFSFGSQNSGSYNSGSRNSIFAKDTQVSKMVKPSIAEAESTKEFSSAGPSAKPDYQEEHERPEAMEQDYESAVKQNFDATIERLKHFGSNIDSWTPAKAKVQSVPSSSCSYAGVKKRGPAKRELEGYLPTMSSLTRAPLTALKEVRAELQKRFPEVSEGFTKIGGSTMDEEKEHASNGSFVESASAPLKVTPKTNGIADDDSEEETETPYDPIGLKWTGPSYDIHDPKWKVTEEDRKVKEDDEQPYDPIGLPSYDIHGLKWKVTEEDWKVKEDEQTLFSQFEASRARLTEKDISQLWEIFKKQESLEQAKKDELEHQKAVAQSEDDVSLKARQGPHYHSRVRYNAVMADRELAQKRNTVPLKPRALPFAANSDFQNPESFAELNKRLKTGSRLSAIVSTSLENKADFRARWESLNSALPREANPEDFVKLVTPGSSPTKPSASKPADPSPNEVSTINVPSNPFSPSESFTDYYTKRFESLGAEAKELIMKAQKNLMSPVAKPKRSFDPADYTKPFCDFLTENPTVFHAVDGFATKLTKAGFEKLSERDLWNSKLEAGGKYFVERNGSSLIAFSVGKAYKSGNGVAMIAGHVDALAARLKPVSTKKTKAGYVQLGVAPYAGALNATWYDRDLGVGGRVLVKDEKTGKIKSTLVKLGWPIARIPTLAPHFGVGMMGSNNAETQAVPIIGLDNSDLSSISKEEDAAWKASSLLGGEGTFAATQPPKLLKAIAGELNIQNYNSIVNWELELFDTQPAQVGGLEKEFIFAGRVDDKLCSWSAMEALLAASEDPSEDDGIISLVGVFDDEEIGSLLRQGAKGNFLPSIIERISEAFSESGNASSNLLSQTYANSFLISADVTHAVNPNFLESYLENHAPRLNVGVVVSADSNGHMTTDSVSTAVMQQIAEKSGSVLQLFMIRNDSRSGGTVGPMLSSAMGVRAIDMGIPQLSMHSIRATTGSLDPGLGVKLFKGFFENFEAVDKEFE